MAIGALERLEGRTFGYRYYDPGWKRHAAIGRWIEYVQGRPGAMAAGEKDHG